MDIRASLTGLRAMVFFSFRKLLSNRRWAIVLLSAVLVGAVMGYSATLEGADADGASDLMNLLMLTFFLPIMALVYGASMIRNEIDDRSITQVITSPLDRRFAYLGYYLALVGALSLVLVLIGAVGWSAYFFLDGLDGDAVSLLPSYSAILVIGSVVYSSLFLALGVLLKQPIYLGLLYVFVWEGFIGSLPGSIGEVTVRQQLRVIASQWIDHGNITFVSGDTMASSVALILITLVTLLLGAVMFREKEIA